MSHGCQWNGSNAGDLAGDGSEGASRFLVGSKSFFLKYLRLTFNPSSEYLSSSHLSKTVVDHRHRISIVSSRSL